MNYDIALTALVVLFAPFIAHLGAVGSDRWRPKPTGWLKYRLGKTIVRRMNTILFVNGAFLATAYVLWELNQQPYFWIPIVFAFPGTVAQIALAAESARQSSK